MAREIANPQGELAMRLKEFASARQLTFETPYDTDETRAGLLLVAPAGLPREDPTDDTDGAGDGSTDDDDTGSFSRHMPQRLAEHAEAVRCRATEFAEKLFLPDRLARSLALAAKWHDGGKSDKRFQFYLSGGSTDGEPLAKSGLGYRGVAADRAARRASGLPDRWRHEVLSVRLAMPRLRDHNDIDPDLVLFLIGTHHGQGRPFFRHEDPWDDREHPDLPSGAGPERLDFEWNGMDWPELFAVLRRRYGTWGLAWLEAVLRLADHRASEAGR
jgi:CRISPR-associated endonuclease/helicase Cas3